MHVLGMPEQAQGENGGTMCPKGGQGLPQRNGFRRNLTA